MKQARRLLEVAAFAGLACLAFAPAAHAVGRDRLPYSGLEASYGRVAFDHSNAAADHYDIRASLDLGGPVPVFVSASRAQYETDETQFGSIRYSTRTTISRVDLGFHFGSDQTANFVPSISLIEAKGEFLGDLALFGSHSETGWAARGAVRALVTPWVELGAFIETIFVAEDATNTAGVQGILYPFAHLGVGVGYETAEGQQTLSARFRIVQ